MKRPQVLLVASAAIILGLLWFTYTIHREPEYQGRSLTEWLRLYGGGTIAGTRTEKAVDAVRHIGTNALPFLVTWVEEDHPLTPRDTRVWKKVASWKSGTHGQNLLLEFIGRRQSQAERALWGFVILGGTARGAAPDLARIATHGNDASARLAISALFYLGRDGVQPLLSVLRDTTSPSWIQYEALVTLGRMRDLGTGAHVGVAALIGCLDDPQFAPSAASTLGMLRLESEISLPALLECTRSTNFDLRKAAVFSLGEFGRGAQAAVPDLTKLKDDPNASLQQEAKIALERIAADASGP